MSRCKAGKPRCLIASSSPFGITNRLENSRPGQDDESFPCRKNPSDCGGSLSRLEMRIQRTSIWTPNYSNSSFSSRVRD